MELETFLQSLRNHNEDAADTGGTYVDIFEDVHNEMLYVVTMDSMECMPTMVGVAKDDFVGKLGNYEPSGSVIKDVYALVGTDGEVLKKLSF